MRPYRRVAVFAVMWLAQTIVIGQTAHGTQSAWQPPRTPDGHPDLHGFWTNVTATPLERPAEFANKAHFTRAEAAEYERTWMARLIKDEEEVDRTGADLNEVYLDNRKVVPDLRTSLIIEPSNGRLPPLVEAAKARTAALSPPNYDDPEARPLGERCILGIDGGQPVTPPIVPNLYNNNSYQIVQTPQYVMIFGEQVHDARIIRIGGRHLPSGVWRWLGDSIGRWEGGVLVVDTTNIHESAAYRGNATARIHVVERFARTGPSTITYRATVDDPDTWSRPWTLEFPFRAADEGPFEYACHEGNLAIENVLRGARAAEKTKQQ